MMRLFIALQPDDNVRNKLYSCALHAGGGRVVSRDNLHMTIVFIGETDRLMEIKKAMDSVRFAHVLIRIDRYGIFGGKQSRLLWAGGEPDNSILKLYNDLRAALAVSGIETEQRMFVPHITLCRRFSGELPKTLPDLVLSADKISLMQSVNENGSVIYKELHSVVAAE